MIEASSLKFSYASAKDPAIDGITFQANAGETIALIGGDNSGKSTLLYLLSGLAPQLLKGERCGQLQVAGLDPSTAPPETRLRAVGMVFANPVSQITGICPSVEEEIAWSLGNLGVNHETMHRQVDEVIQQLHLEEIRHRIPWQLSSGQQQLVAIASALVLQPQVLLFDEPISSLDAHSRKAVMAAALDLAQAGHTIIWATPELESVANFSRWIYLDRGQISYDGPPNWLGKTALPAAWTRLAQKAQAQGLWSQPLPFTEHEAAEGFGAIIHSHDNHKA